MTSRPFQFFRRNAPKSERERPSTLKDWLPCSPIQGVAVKARCNPFIFALTVAHCPATFSGVWLQLRDTLSTSQSVRRGLLYTPCLLMNPDLRLRLHATQAQPCFPAASNALVLPGGNGIFTATLTECITHYTLLRKVVYQRDTLWKAYFVGVCNYTSSKTQNKRLQSAVKITA